MSYKQYSCELESKGSRSLNIKLMNFIRVDSHCEESLRIIIKKRHPLFLLKEQRLS